MTASNHQNVQESADKQPAIILASGSPRRIDLMKNLGLQFEVLPADIEEITEEATTPAEVVTELARKKAQRTHEMLEERSQAAPYVILAADTLVILDDDILGKPTDRADAIKMLERMSGRSHQVFTGIYVIYTDGENKTVSYQDVGISQVHFRKLQRTEIEHYVDTKEPMDKAGAYALQGIGAFLITGIEGCPTNIIGLPLPLTMTLLRKCNIPILGY